MITAKMSYSCLPSWPLVLFGVLEPFALYVYPGLFNGKQEAGTEIATTEYGHTSPP